MPLLSTKVHGILDYITGVFLIVSPWVFGFDDQGMAQWIPIFLGVSAILYSLFTDYELGLVRRLPMRLHLTLDVVSGIVLATSPWLFNFADYVYLPHVILGIFEIGAGLITRRTPASVHLK
ncbi:SPW repeat protein [Larkinella ripae]